MTENRQRLARSAARAAVLVLSSIALLAAEPMSAWLPVTFESVTQSEPGPIQGKIHFGDKAVVASELSKIEHIATLFAEGVTPHFILSGRSCSECDMHTSLYIYSPDDGALLRTHERHPYPGEKYDYLAPKSLVEEIRMFHGSCLEGRGPVAIWFYRFQNESREWERAVYIAEKRGAKIQAETLREELPDVAAVKIAVGSGVCTELQGIRGTTEP